MQTQTADAARGRVWVLGGWALVNRNPGLWAGMTAVYLLIAFVLNQIPFIGYLLLLWITPVFAGGAAIVARNLDTGASAAISGADGDLRVRVRRALESSVSALFAIFWLPDKTLALMVIGTAALGATVLVQILSELLQMSAGHLPALLMSGVGVGIWGPQLLSFVIVWVLQISVVLATLYAVLGVVLDDRMSWPAIEQAAAMLARNPLPIAVFGAVFLIPMLAAQNFASPFGLLVNALMIPIFLPSLYLSHKELRV
ncbi:MAG: hypothetical protein ACYCQK_02560 [Acidiferrobacteraceae bacterium]